jgi:FKBP-type peptidyl-prolyl cis-trans isomerase
VQGRESRETVSSRRAALLLRTTALLALLLAAVASSCRRDGASAPPSAPVTLPSGLVEQELVVGAGDEARDGRYVALHYDAWLAAAAGAPRGDAPFDSTRQGAPWVVALGKTPLLAGFAEGVRGMKRGGRRRLTIPPALAYGPLGKGLVPPDATLEYEVELVDVFTALPSGLQYRVVEPGDGTPPTDGQRVVVELRGWLVETGRELFSTYATKQPLEFELGKTPLLAGLVEALRLMKPRAKWTVAIPPALAYGVLGQGFQMLPGEDVLVDVELVGTRRS